MTGTVAGIVYLSASNLLVRLKIDDAVDAIPVHFFNGLWGLVAVGLFASPLKLENAYGRSKHVGWCYSWSKGSSDATLLGTNLVGFLFIVGWVLFTMLPFFFLLSYLGWFRSDPLEEIVGLDISYHGGSAYRVDTVKQEYPQNSLNIRDSFHIDIPGQSTAVDYSVSQRISEEGETESI